MILESTLMTKIKQSLLKYDIESLLRFFATGIFNASIYSLLLLLFLTFELQHFIALLLSQILIIFISFFTFSYFGFQKNYNNYNLIKFLLSNLFLYLCSSMLIWVFSMYSNSNILFVLVNIFTITPISYILNKFYVFK